MSYPRFIATDPIIVQAKESSDAVLKPPHSSGLVQGRARPKSRFPQAPSLASCTEKNWFKYDGQHSFPRIAHLESDNSLLYYGNFCYKRASPCQESQKLELDSFTGYLTMHDVTLADEDDYYYFCGIEDQWPNYELVKLEILGIKNTFNKIYCTNLFLN